MTDTPVQTPQGFFSILFPTPEQEARANAHDWLTPAKRVISRKKRYVMQGNKMVLTDAQDEPCDTDRPAVYVDTRFLAIVEAVCHGPHAETTKAYYQSFCCDADMLAYRHEVFRVLADTAARALLRAFCEGIEYAQNALAYARQLTNDAQQDRCALDAVYAYGQALSLLTEGAPRLSRSRGLTAFANAAKQALDAPEFQSLFAETTAVRNAMDAIEVQVAIHSGAATVDTGHIAQDYVRTLRDSLAADSLWQIETSRESSEIRLFQKLGLNPLETRVLERVIARNPDVFARMRRAALRVGSLIEPFIARFVAELRFYTAFCSFMDAHGDLPFALPCLSRDDGIDIQGAVDLALALTDVPVATNDAQFAPNERGAVITGANQGGKTTFARALGQIVLMTMLGLPVCCSQATLPLYRQAFSAFSESEDTTIDSGKLQEECTRLKPLLASANAETFVLLNEMFSSTTARDALRLTVEVLDGLVAKGARTICVTHIHGIRNLRPDIVGMATGAPNASGERDYKILRSQPDGNAYARDISEKYDLTADGIRRRFHNAM